MKREVVVDHATREAEITFTVTEGPIARMGPVRFSGTKEIDTTYLQRRVPFKAGEPYDPAKVDALRGKLTSLGVFNAVRIKPAPALDANGELPIDVELTDRLARSIGFGVSYETQLGFAVSGFWTHRNLFGQAESLRLTAEINHIGQGLAITDTGFAFRADFRKPDWWLPGQDGRATAEALREVLPAYNRNAIVFFGGIDRIISPVWQVRAGLAAEASQVARTSTAIWQSYRLLGVPASVLMNKANSDVDPTTGYRLQLDVTPYGDVGPNNDFFSIIRLTGRSYFDLAEPGRSVLALRASFGTEPATNIAGIPPDKLFYAGGGGSVRGFVYQSAGPRDAFNNPLGGASVVEGSVEFRQRIGKSFGAVAFVDAGSAYPDMLPNFSLFAPRVGAGVGAALLHRFRSGAARCRLAAQPSRRRPAVRHLCQPGAGFLMRALRLFAMVAGGVAGLAALLFAFLQTPPGQRALAGLSRTALCRCRASAASSRPISTWRASTSLMARDRGCGSENARLRWSFASLFAGRVRVENLSAGLVDVLRDASAAEGGTGDGKRHVRTAAGSRCAGLLGRCSPSRGAPRRRRLALDPARQWPAACRPA